MKIVDMHCDTISCIDQRQRSGKDINLNDNDLHVSIQNMKKAGYLLQNFALFTNLKKVDDPLVHVQHLIDTFYNEVDKYKEDIIVIKSYQDIITNMDKSKILAMLTLEEGAVVNNDLSYLRNYYRLGVRMVTLTWNYENGIGYPNFDQTLPDHGYYQKDDVNGLTDFGIEYIKECEKLGIIIDVSHLSDAGFYDVVKYTTKPFVASHSNARALCPHARNLTDDMIRLIAKRNGVIGINFAADFLDENKTDKSQVSYISSIIKHILYIKEIGGIDCIGLGSDFDGIDPNLEIKNASYMPLLYEALKEYLSEEEIEKIFYKNVLRVYKEVLK